MFYTLVGSLITPSAFIVGWGADHPPLISFVFGVCLAGSLITMIYVGKNKKAITSLHIHIRGIHGLPHPFQYITHIIPVIIVASRSDCPSLELLVRLRLSLRKVGPRLANSSSAISSSASLLCNSSSASCGHASPSLLSFPYGLGNLSSPAVLPT